MSNEPRLTPPLKNRRRYSRWMFILMWLFVLALLSVFFDDYLEQQYNPNQQIISNTSGGQAEVVLQRNRQGHYVTNGIINGTEVVFLLDTGATEVTIPQNIADRLGLRLGREYQVHTANGTTYAYDTMLDSVAIGDIILNDIAASVTPSYQSDAILLGMSFLQHIEFTQRGNTLILRN